LIASTLSAHCSPGGNPGSQSGPALQMPCKVSCLSDHSRGLRPDPPPWLSRRSLPSFVSGLVAGLAVSRDRVGVLHARLAVLRSAPRSSRECLNSPLHARLWQIADDERRDGERPRSPGSAILRSHTTSNPRLLSRTIMRPSSAMEITLSFHKRDAAVVYARRRRRRHLAVVAGIIFHFDDALLAGLTGRSRTRTPSVRTYICPSSTNRGVAARCCQA